ncbi:kinase-like domain-containing protein [Rhizophagus irregularis DAOM 181602=DAOM 197198]|nr:kinase-like domain-containing protein [Rhizophagus irregularis DAOM 181602=DAOM 197198]
MSESINWIEEAIFKKHLKFYEYKKFSNFQQISVGSIGKVYRANYDKNLEKQFAIKSFFNFNNITLKEIIRELKIQRVNDLRDNIMYCYGITKFESENYDNYNYMLVMECADGASAVSCLHNEGIVHHDLHSGNILVHQNKIKETIVPDTPEDYIKIYTKCWDNEPDNRPTIYQVVNWLKEIISNTVVTQNTQFSSKQELNENLESQREISQFIQNFNKINIQEIDPTILSNEREKVLFEKGFDIIDEVNDYIIKLVNRGIEWQMLKRQIIDYFVNYNIDLQEMYNWH